MQIITVNIPRSYDQALKVFYGENKIYPSRSELVRVAVQRYIQRIIEKIKPPMTPVDPKFIEDNTSFVIQNKVYQKVKKAI